MWSPIAKCQAESPSPKGSSLCRKGRVQRKKETISRTETAAADRKVGFNFNLIPAAAGTALLSLSPLPSPMAGKLKLRAYKSCFSGRFETIVIFLNQIGTATRTMQLRSILIAGLLLLVLLIFGCSQKQEVTCNSPYIKVGTECCLDQNRNNVCDKDETPTAAASRPAENTNATASPAPVCNKPYLLVGTACCLDKNANAICDSDDEMADKKAPAASGSNNASVAEMRDTLVTIQVHTRTPEPNEVQPTT